MKIKVGQIRAARALLNWSQKDLAARAGVSDMSIMNYESGKRTPHQDTLEKILQAFEIGGVIFTKNGVELKQDSIILLEGHPGIEAFFDIVYETCILEPEIQITVANADERLFSKWLADFSPIHRKRMTLLKIKPIKALLKKNDTNLTAGDYADYRWVESKYFGDICIYKFGEKTGLIEMSDTRCVITLIDNALLSETIAKLLQLAWDNAHVKP